MSDVAVIAQVTQKLRQKLAEAHALGGSRAVTSASLHKLADGDSENPKLNLFLYQVLPNAPRMNSTLPWKVSQGEAAQPPLALELRYLLTAIAADQVKAQEHLGIGMQILHDNPILDPGGSAVAPFERARVTMHPLSLDEMEKLWAGVSAPRRLSVAYEVSVVLIESAKPGRSPLPVLSRGTGLDSIEVQANLYPNIERIEIGNHGFDKWLRSRSKRGRFTAEVDDDLLVFGEGLAAADRATIVSLLFPKRWIEVEGPFATGDGGAVVIPLSKAKPGKGPKPEEGAETPFPAGPCTIALSIKRNRTSGNGRSTTDRTNSLPFSLAPRIAAKVPDAVPIGSDLTVTLEPPLVAKQNTALIVGDQQLPPKSIAAGNQVLFKFTNLAPGDYYVRVRVDGVDSALIDLDAEPPASERPKFSDKYKVRVVSPG